LFSPSGFNWACLLITGYSFIPESRAPRGKKFVRRTMGGEPCAERLHPVAGQLTPAPIGVAKSEEYRRDPQAEATLPAQGECLGMPGGPIGGRARVP
jgi:hypothetical protein